MKLYFLIILMLLLSSSSILADDMSYQKNFVDLKLAIKYPQLLNNNVSTNFMPEAEAVSLNLNSETELANGIKSKGKSLLFSILVPGAGEYYLGKKTLAKSFFITELVLWAGYFSFKAYSDWKRDDMYLFAANYADADVNGKPSQFFVDIGNYSDIYEYNDAKQRRGEVFSIYSEEDNYWSWDSAENQQKFEQMRISSDRAYHRSTFAIGGIITNHLLSAIDAVWQSYIYNKKLTKKANHNKGIKIHFGGIKPSGNVLIAVEKAF